MGFEAWTGAQKRLKRYAAIFKQDELNFFFARSGQIYSLNLSGCELKIIANACPVKQVRREADTASARVKWAKKRRGRERAGFADANFNVKFRLKPGFDLDKFELAADGSDGRRGYFIDEPGESRGLDFARSEADGFAHSGSGEFARSEASKSMCEEADKFKQDERVRYLATKPVLARKFRQKARKF